ncbi:MAG: hypothetical protein ACREXP_12290, partial [Steroidobacteraceae bacterium]
LDPLGNVLKSGALGATPLTCTGCNGYAGTVTVDSGLLPATGTYSVLVQQTALPPFDTDRLTPYVGGVGTLTLELTELQPGTGSTTNINTTVPGQVASVTFSAAAGQTVSVALGNAVLSPASATTYYVNLYAPNGAHVSGLSCWSLNPCDVLHVRQLPQTGTYRVDVSPPSSHTISGTLTIASALTGALSTAVPFSANLTAAGQSAHLSFTATASQTFALALSSLSTTPANTRMYMNVYNAAGQQLYNSSTTGASLTFNLPNLAAGTYYVWIVPQYPATSTMQVTLHPRAGGTLTTDGTPSSFSTTARGQIAYFDFAATAGESVSVALQNVVLTPSTQASYYTYVYAPNGANVGFLNCWSGSSVCDVLHMRNLPQTGNYRIEVITSTPQTLSGALTVSLDVTGTLSTSAPVSLSLNKVGQGAHLSFTATAGETFALAITSLSTTPANTRVYMNVYNAAGQQLYNSSTTTSNMTFNLPNLAAGTYYAWIIPQYPATSTLQVTLHPRVGGTVATDGTPATFSTVATGQTAYFEFAATAGQSVSVSLTNVALSPSAQAQYFASVFAPNGANVGWIACWSTWTVCDVLHMRNLPQTGTYRVELSTYATHTFSGTLTVALAQTGSLSPDVPLDLTLSKVGQAAHLSFTVTAGQIVSVHLGPLSTVPADTRMYVNVYNAAGANVGSTSSTVGSSVVLPNLPAGTYYAWVMPQYPATSTVQLTMRPAVAVPTDGTATSLDTTARGQSRSFTFSGTAGGSVSIALSDIVVSPSGSTVQYWFAVYRPDGQNVWTNTCWSNWTACDVMHLRDLLQTGTYRIDVGVSSTHTLSGTLTVTQALTGTLTSGVPVNVSLPLLGQTKLFGMTLPAAQPVSVTATSVSTTPAGRPMQIYVFNPSGSLIASGSGTTGITVNMGTLPAGAYKVWVVPQYPATSSMVVGY